MLPRLALLTEAAPQSSQKHQQQDPWKQQDPWEAEHAVELAVEHSWESKAVELALLLMFLPLLAGEYSPAAAVLPNLLVTPSQEYSAAVPVLPHLLVPPSRGTTPTM